MSDFFRELIAADLALVLDVAPAHEVAQALERFWNSQHRVESRLQEELQEVAGLTVDDLRKLEREVERVVAAARGDSQLALQDRGGLDWSIVRSLGADSQIVRDLGQMGAFDPNLLREVDTDRYRDRVPIGKGGMGDVFVARDVELDREVALKVMRDDRGDVRRFLQEARLTSALDHPGILPIYEVGRLDERPFYAMRYVRGERTLLAAIQEAPSRAARLDLLEPLLRACDAVAYAHAHGVLHCDLKPGNIALGEFGEALVLDWGLALRTSTAAAQAGPIGTPGYMSPEARGDGAGPLSPQSDVYSLGATLHHVLHGQPPTPDGAQPAAEDAPQRLQALCARALSRDLADRFPSVAAFADALRSWRQRREMEHETDILAREASVLLEGGSAGGRQRSAQRLDRVATIIERMRELDPDNAAATALLARCQEERRRLRVEFERQARGRLLRRVAAVAVLLLGIAATVVAAVLGEERDRANEARASAEDLGGFMVFDLHESLARVGRIDLLRPVIAKALAHYAAQPLAGQDARSIRNRSAALSHLGHVADLVGDFDAGLALHRQAQEAARHLLRRHPSDLQARREVNLHAGSVAAVLLRKGDLAGALDQQSASNVECEHVVREHPANDDAKIDLAEGLLRLGNVLAKSGRPADALDPYQQAHSILEGVATRVPDDDRGQKGLAHVLQATALALRDTGRLKEALSPFEAAVELYRTRVAQDPHDTRRQDDLATALIELGGLQARLDRHDEALHHLLASLAIRKTLADRDSEIWGRQRMLGLVHLGLADYYGRRYDDQNEAQHLIIAAPIFRDAARKLPDNVVAQGDLVSTLTRLGNFRMRSGESRDALALFEESLAGHEEIAGKDAQDPDWEVDRALSYERLGSLYLSHQNYDQSLAEQTRAHDLLRELLERLPDRAEWRASFAWVLFGLGRSHEACGELAAAEERYRQASEEYGRLPSDTRGSSRVLGGLASLYSQWGSMHARQESFEVALTHLERAVQIREELLWRDDTASRCQKLAFDYVRLGNIRARMDDIHSAFEQYEIALHLHEVALDRDPKFAKVHEWYVDRHRRFALITGARPPENAVDRFELALEDFERHEYAESLNRFRVVLLEKDVLSERDYQHALYAAARCAARVCASWKGPDRTALLEEAVGWIAQHLATIHQRMTELEGLQRDPSREDLKDLEKEHEEWAEQLAFVEHESDDLAPLRETAAWATLMKAK